MRLNEVNFRKACSFAWCSGTNNSPCSTIVLQVPPHRLCMRLDYIWTSLCEHIHSFLRWVVTLFSRWHSSDSATWYLGAWRDVTFKAALSRVINVDDTSKFWGGGVLLQRVDTEQDSYLVYLSTRDTRPSAGLCCEGGDMMQWWCICDN